MNRLFLIIFSLSLLNCSTDRTIIELTDIEEDSLVNFQKLPRKSILKITEENEPGEKLLLCLTFIDKESKLSLSNQLVKFYHTTNNGNYEQTDPNDEYSARLNGQSVTNNTGQIYLETILPGDYGGSNDNRHIHTTVVGAKPEAYDIFFKQYSGNGIGQYLNSGNDQMFVTELKKTKKNKLVSFLTIGVKKPDQ